MTKLDELFEKKYGAIRGDQTKLAKDLGADQSTISGWIKGRTTPTKDFLKKMAKLFGVSEVEVLSAFGQTNIFFQNSGNIAGHDQCISSGLDVRVALLEKDIEIIKKDLEILKLKSQK